MESLKKSWQALLGLALAACIPVVSHVQPSAEAVGVANGRHIVEAHCAGCHAIGRTGDSPHPQAPPFSTLSQRYPIDDLAEAFAEGVRVGHPDMPEFQFAPPDIDDLLAYLKTLQSATPPHR